MEIIRLPVGIMEANCYLLLSGDEITIIDPGDEAAKIISKVKKWAKKLKYIIYTHCHRDHVSAGNEVRLALEGETLIHSGEKGLYSGLKIDRFLEEGEILIGGEVLRVLHTPGHTPGSICLLGNRFIITGDTLFQDGIGRTDFVGGSKEDMERSLIKINNIIGQGTRIYPGHGSDFTKNN